MNFKTITRENNPQYGESQGGSYNVPGNRDYPMFCVPVLQENGEEAYDLYTMKQPLSVNFMYTVSVICNKYEILNKFNEAIQYEFSALECYIAPNDHYMPMVIESINDESEYSLDDRKYYAQTYNIKVLAYIIRKEDFKVTKIPSRFSVRLLGTEKLHKYKKVKKNDGKNVAEVKGMSLVPTLVPVPPTVLESMKQDPLSFESIWLSRNKRFLNVSIILKTGKVDEEDLYQTIAVAQDNVEEHDDGTKTLCCRLYHDQNNVPEYYSAQRYFSIPIRSLTADSLRLTIKTYSGETVKTLAIK
jgi:hypothetical protein